MLTYVQELRSSYKRFIQYTKLLSYKNALLKSNNHFEAFPNLIDSFVAYCLVPRHSITGSRVQFPVEPSGF